MVPSGSSTRQVRATFRLKYFVAGSYRNLLRPSRARDAEVENQLIVGEKLPYVLNSLMRRNRVTAVIYYGANP